jgi:predicted ATPase
MLKRLYVHNYKCLVNFEINFDKDISLFLGANGSGKSTVFEVLDKLRRVIVDEEKVANVFDYRDTPRWLTPNLMSEPDIRFEVDIVGSNDDLYKYLLIIDVAEDDSGVLCIKEESLSCEELLFIQTKDGKTIRFSNNNQDLPFENSRSCIRYFYIAPFFNAWRTLFIIRIKPYEIASTINKANSALKTDCSNFAEWFAHLNENNRKEVSAYENAMRNILPGFDYFKIVQAGQAKLLQVDFEDKSDKKKIVSYSFHELSEGQKALLILYALMYCAPENSLICIDEPENFLSLPEIQPWFDTLYDQCVERGLQALLISHHPRIINFLANDSGYWFSRENNFSRVQKISAENDSGLSIAELVELGWIDDE